MQCVHMGSVLEMEKMDSVMQCPVCKTKHIPKDEQKKSGVFAGNCENCGHFFKYRAVPPFKSNVSFTVNGVAYTVGNEFSASTSLADFLREKRVSMGTKIMCKQGGCGICIVEAKMQLQAGQPKVAANLNSCLCPLFLCDGWDITTIEGLGNTRTGMHVIQSNLSDFGGTQCGYCSPGHVMNMYGLTQKYPSMNKQFVEDHFEGNLCRCTGYRPILDAFKALVPASADDIEDLSKKMCVNNPNKMCDSNGHCGGACHSNGPTKPIRMVLDSIQWVKATNYADLQRLLQQYAGKKIRLMGANTGTGAFYMAENVHNFEVVIDISGVPEFFVNAYDSSSQTFTLGANVTLSDLIDLFTKEAAKSGASGGFNELKKYLYRVASSPIRNRATWAGNLMLKNHNNSFQSDVFCLFEALKASLYIGPTPQDILTPGAFLTTSMSGKALSRATFGNIPANDVIACFKVMPRAQNSLALVTAAIRCTVDPSNNYSVSGQPIISIGGISGTFHRATKTETFLVGKQLSSASTLTGAMGVLVSELVPSNDITLPSAPYRKLVACSLVYKYFLRVLGNAAGSRYRSGSTVLHDIRPLSSGTQSYDTKKVDWPVDQPLKKLEGDIQCTGEAEYTDDIAPEPGQLYASFVKSTQANATIQNIDTSAAMAMTGVFKVLTASDIPAGGKNDVNGPSISGLPMTPEEALASSKIDWYGQPMALVLADSQETADQAAFRVTVTYTNIQTPIVDLDDAIKKKSFFPLPGMPTVDVGNADQAVAMSPYVTSGSFYVPSQYHFHMETQTCNVVPTDEGLEVTTTTQWTQSVQQAVAAICAIKKNRVMVKTKRLGGSYGGKITRNNIVASVCGLAAYVTNRPVRMRMALWDNMEMVGKRIPWKADYQVGHDGNGKLNGVIVTFYSDLGYLVNEVNIPLMFDFMDNAYYCSAWKANGVAVKTNKPINTACRGPGSVPAIYIMEQMMEHVARKLNKDPMAVKTLNLYKQGQVTPTKMTLNHCNLETCYNELMASAQVALRQKTFDYFNTANRWKKKGMGVVPLKWGASVAFAKFSVLVNIHSGDGSVLVHHGGVEMGQGINTKVAQVCAYELDVPVNMVAVRTTNTDIEVNNMTSGGSITSETCCQGVITACTAIKARMAPVKARMKDPTWTELVNRCLMERVYLTEKVVVQPKETPPFSYNIYGAACAEVELDVLTGEYQVNRVDIVHDCGESLNPAVDLGQVEGGFIQGMGISTGEEIKFNPTTGQILTNNTWTYHPPTNKDIPVDFRISLLKNTPNPVGILRSKASGEPPLCMSCAVFFALRKCIEEARKDAGDTSYFDFNPPATVEKVQTLCKVATSQFKLQKSAHCSSILASLMADVKFPVQCPVCQTRHLPRNGHPSTGTAFAATCENCGHFFKYRAVPPYKTNISFTVNGVAYTAGNEFNASTSLADFLREKRVSMGTKIMCKQGGCGICIVEAKMALQAGQTKVAAALNSCLCPLFLCDGWEITTVEGLGSTRTGMHKIQSTLADHNGTQCGYCSPGHVMNMYGLTQQYPNMTKEFVEDHFEGNLCRCTGYRPILDAFKALVPTTTRDIEDVGTKLCSKNPDKLCSSNGSCAGSCKSTALVKAVRMVFGNVQWFKADDYADLLNLLQQYRGQKIRLMGANTGTGAFYMTENIHNFDIVIDISGVPEFHINTYDSSTKTYTLGANVTLSDMIDLFTKEAAKPGASGGFNELKKYLYRIASSPIRNRATWSGNLMLKNHHKDFPSDVFNIMTVLKASLYVGTTPQDILTPDAFFITNMSGKGLSKFTFSDISTNDVIVCFKVMPRSQNSLALVNAAVRCTVDPQTFTVSGQPIISIGGISGTFHRATRTESYLVGKQLSAAQTLTGAMSTLATELVPSNDIRLPSAAYRKVVACALVYKFFLRVLGNRAGTRYRSGSTVLHDTRPLSSGTQTFDTKKIEWPLNQPLKKLEADIQCTGEAEYTDDVPPQPGQLYGSFVKSSQGNAKIQHMDTSAAMALSSGQVYYYGQAIALVLADSQEIADQAAAMVKVDYTNIQIPILTIDDAIQKKSFFPGSPRKVDVGNAEQAISMSPFVTSGSFDVGNQYHLHMETQCAVAVPTDEGLKITSSTQFTDCVQQGVAQICGIPKNRVTVEVKRLGGGFGAKMTRSNIVASVCGLAAFITNRPVRMKLALWDNMEMVGKRMNYKVDYQVGHDADGKLNGIVLQYYVETGYLDSNNIGSMYGYMDNSYYCPNWKASGVAVKTNKPVNPPCRGPASVPAIFMMEQMIEHVARTLNKDPLAVKSLTFYKQGQITPMNMTLNHCNLQVVLNELMATAQLILRQTTMTYFNKNNRWKKRALSVVPMKWGANPSYSIFPVLVNIYAKDGSVLVHHGGVEMGQGINTKVAQVCAYELGIPISMVTVRGTNTVVEPNNMNTGGSVTSESCCQGVIVCCTNIKARMSPVKAKMTNPSWVDLVNQCVRLRVPLSEKVINVPPITSPYKYNIYAATCTEVELDVLTGEYQVNRVDIVYDCGESLSPALDLGQIEGGFVMGMGYSMAEEINYDPTTGKILTNDTWTYHPPTNKDIPVDFRISLLKNSPNPTGVLRSKATGEPPLCMGCSVFFALRKCIEEARKDAGHTGYFDFCPPATVEKVQTLCMVDTSQFKLQ